MTIEEILALPDVGQKITLLKKGRKTNQPDRHQLWADWNINRHDIIRNKEKYPDKKVLVKEAEQRYDEASGKTYTIEAQYKTEEINRISIPLEQDIVNIHTAFTVGIEPKIICNPYDESEASLCDTLKRVLKNNKIKFRNKKIVRSWLSEQEVAEYWYTVKDESFWGKLWRKLKTNFGGRVKPDKRLKSVIWSPFRGDTLYPYMDDKGDMIAFSREYIKVSGDGNEEKMFTTITDTHVYTWNENTGEEVSFRHGFEKLPVIYTYRDEAYCAKIKSFRERLEKLLSNYADCIDYHFFPLLKLIGDVVGFSGRTKDRMVKLENGADAQYLTWNQVPDTVKFEVESLINMAYDMTNTPRISFEEMKGIGNASGVSLKLMFMGAHMAVSNHAEDIEEFMQRRINFLVSALGSINPYEFLEVSKTIDIETEIVPYMIDDISEKVSIATNAVSGGIWSRREGIVFAGNADRVDEELKAIEEEQKTDGEPQPKKE